MDANEASTFEQCDLCHIWHIRTGRSVYIPFVKWNMTRRGIRSVATTAVSTSSSVEPCRLDGFDGKRGRQAAISAEGTGRPEFVKPACPRSIHLLQFEKRLQSVVLVHGSSASSRSMHPFAQCFAQAGFAVDAFDMRGHGDSGPRGDIAYIGQLDDDMEDFMHAVQPAGPKTLVGFSAGGGFAIRVAGGTRQALFDNYLFMAPAIHRRAPTYRPNAGGWAPDADAFERALSQWRHVLSAADVTTPPIAPLKRIAASDAGGSIVHMVPMDEVQYFEAADKYVRVLTATHEYLIRTPLKQLLPQLDPNVFCQVHRALVVRTDAIDSAQRDDAGKLQLTLRGRPEKIPVSRLYAHLFRAM
ncbi:alpha/beta fold hydrolase [Pendulispora brunnea]|uniref:Alpha/beta fold hydrolase n=1 Tax=Pendulispora brunnea TaxID=2905690 RepID=A0ABZ2KFK1_9BACT